MDTFIGVSSLAERTDQAGPGRGEECIGSPGERASRTFTECLDGCCHATLVFSSQSSL